MGSLFGSINIKDLGKGFLISTGTVFFTGLGLTLVRGVPSGGQLLLLTYAGIAAGGTYVFKNLFTNSQNQLLTRETPASVKAALTSVASEVPPSEGKPQKNLSDQ